MRATTGILTTALLAAGLALAGAPAEACAPGLQDVERAYAAALEQTPVPLWVQADQARWLDDGDRSPQALADRVETLQARAARDRAARSLRLASDDLASACVAIALEGCRTETGGYLARPGGPVLYWQVQGGFTFEDGVSAGFVLLEAGDDGLRPVAWDFGGGAYDPPVWIEPPGSGENEAPGPLHVAVPGIYGGTGAHNADVIFRWAPETPARLVQIDNTGWWRDLDDRLPPGLEVWKGVDFRYGALMAVTALWRPGDGNCCPTGGDAALEFIIADDRLTLTNAYVSDPLASLALTLPVEVFDYARRRLHCAHWAGEEPYDAERAADIARAVADLRCEALDGDGAALRAAHADNRAVMAALERVEAL